jgi:MFS family permease
LKINTFKSLSIHPFRYYFMALMSQTASMSMQATARGLLMYRLTGSVELLGLLFLASSLPELLFSLWGGVIADRVPKKLVMMAGQAGYMLTALFVGLALTFNILSADKEMSWLILIGITVIRGTIQGLAAPSRAALIPELVGKKLIMNAIALRNMGRNTMRLAVPALAGFLIDAFNFEVVYYAQTVLYALAIISTSHLPFIPHGPASKHSVAEQLKHGLKYVYREKRILFVLAFTLLISVLSMPYIQLMPVFVEDILNVGATGMGILFSVSAAGALIGSVALASLPNRKRGILLVLTGLLLGLVLTGFAFSNIWAFSLAFMLFIGAGNTIRMTLSNTLLQSYSADNYRGRVMSVYSMEHGLVGFAGFMAALLAGVIGVQWAVGGMAILLIVATLLILMFVRQVRTLD